MLPLLPATSRLYDSSFEVLSQQAESIEQARILFFSSSHLSPLQSDKVANCIQRIYKEGDCILLETAQNQSRPYLAIDFVARPLNIQAWYAKPIENRRAYNKHLIKALLLIDEVRKNGLMHWRWIHKIHSFIELFPFPLDQRRNMVQEKYSKNALSLLTSPQERLDCFNSLVNLLAQAYRNEMTTLLSHNSHNLLQAIQTHFPATSRLFVIAHINYISIDHNLTSYPNFTHLAHMLDPYFYDKTYAILYPHTPQALLKDSDQNKKSLWKTIHQLFGSFLKQKKAYLCCGSLFLAPLLLAVILLALPCLLCCKIKTCFNAIFVDDYLNELNTLSATPLLAALNSAAVDPYLRPRQRGTARLSFRTD